MKRIVFINGWSDDNKGDSAIVQGLISLINKTYFLQNYDIEEMPVFGIISGFSSDDANFYYHHRFISSLYKINLYSSLIGHRVMVNNKLKRRLELIGLLIRSLFLLGAAGLYKRKFEWFLNQAERESMRALKDADIVISKGGHIYFSLGGRTSFIGLYIVLFPLLLAQRLGKQTIIYGHSIGPVKGFFQRLVLKYALMKTKIIFAREPLSQQLVNDLFKNTCNKKCQLVWDTAFLCPSQELSNRIIEMLPESFVTLTIRQWHFPEEYNQNRSEKYHRYLKIMAQIIQLINQEYKLPVLLAPQVIGPSQLDNDFLAWDDLKKYAKDFNYIELREDLSPGQLKMLYKKSEMVIGTRFHSVILALSDDIPVIAISYHGLKSKGIMKMLGFDDLVFDIDNLEIENLWEKINHVKNNTTLIKTQLKDINDKILKESIEKCNMVCSSINLPVKFGEWRVNYTRNIT